MKIFDIQKRDLTYCFKVWDNELHYLKDLAKTKRWNLTIESRNRWDVLRTVQVSASEKSKFDALTAQILDIPGIAFEGGKPPSRPSARASSQKQAAKRSVNTKSKTSTSRVQLARRKK